MTNSFESKPHTLYLFVLLIVSYFLLMFGNGLVAMTHPDEVFYMQSAKEMAAADEWLTPMIFDHPQFEKPFLPFAMFAAAIKMFGLNAASARFFPAIFGMLGTLIAYWLGVMLFKSKRAGFFSGFVLSTSFIYLALSRAVLTDMIFSVIIAISLAFFYWSYINPSRRNLGIILANVFMGLAVLTKGLLGITFIVTTIILFLIFKHDRDYLKQPIVWFGVLICLFIAFPWHWIMYQQHGDWFLTEYFGNVHFRRLFDAEHSRLDNWYFYPGLMFGGVLPWSLVWFETVRNIFSQIKNKLPDRDSILFCLGWIFSVLLYTQTATSKLASYIFPLFPAVALLMGNTIDLALKRFEEGKDSMAFRKTGFAMVIVMIGIVVGGYIASHIIYRDFIGDLTAVYVTMGLAIVTLVSILIFNLLKQPQQMLMSFGIFTASILVMLLLARPLAEPWVSCKAVCEVFNKIDQGDSTVLASKFYVRGIRYFTDRPMAVIDINGKGFWSPHPIPFLNKDHMVIDFLNQRKVTYAVLKEGNVEDMERITKNKPFRVENLYGIGGKYILRITRLNS